MVTCDVVAKYPGCDYVSARCKHAFKIGLGEVLREAAHVQIGSLDRFAAGSGV